MSGKLTYKQSGVDTKEAAAFVSDISSHVKRTPKQRSLHAAYDLSSYKEPVIVTGCDGVGTKTEILFELDMVETAGKDLVAMNVNDILTTGGDPLLFLDYLGISNLERERSRITRLVAGMCDYLESCNCILAGGETAEMPGVVPESIVELSGFCIGFQFLIALNGGFTLVFPLLSQLPCGFFIGLGKLYKGFVFRFALGSPCADILLFSSFHHGGILWISCHSCFFTLLFALSGYGFLGFQSFPRLSGFRVCFCGFFQLLSG